MIALKLATLMKTHEDAIARAWLRKATDLIGDSRANSLAGEGHRNASQGVKLAAEHLHGELKRDDLHRWAADLGRHAHAGKIRADQLLGWFIAGRSATREFILNEDVFSSAAAAMDAAAVLHRNAAFFDQAALDALAVQDAESKGHAHHTDAPHLFK